MGKLNQKPPVVPFMVAIFNVSCFQFQHFFPFFGDVLNMFHGQLIVCRNCHHFATLVAWTTESATLQDTRLGV